MKIGIVLLVAGTACAACGESFYASPTGSATAACTAEDPGTIQAAFAKAEARYKAGTKPTSFDEGDEIILAKGDYDFSAATGETPTFGSGNACAYVTAKCLTIRAADGCTKPDDVRIIGGGIGTDLRGFALNGLMRVIGIAFTNLVTSDSGGGVYCHNGTTTDKLACSGLPSFSNCSFRCCGATNGGGVYWNNLSTPPEFSRHCVFANCTASGYGAAARANCTKLYFADCSFNGNSGGKGVVWTGNDSSNYGGGEVTDCGFTNNVCTSAVLGNGSRQHVVTRCSFVGNSAGTCVNGGSPLVHDSYFENNVGSFTGGACVSYGGGVYDSHFLNNTNAMPSGTYDCYGAIVLSPSLSIVSNCSFTGSRTTGGRYKIGGAVGGGCSIYDSAFTNNVSGTYGGAVSSSNKATAYEVRRCIFFQNDGGEQAGISWNGATLYDCVCISNAAKANVDGGCTAAYNCFYFDNRSTSKSSTATSGGLYGNCTFAFDGGDRGCFGNKSKAVNSIFYKCRAGAVGEHNLKVDNSCWVTNCLLTDGYYTGYVNGMSLNGASTIAATLQTLRDTYGCITTYDGLKMNNLVRPDGFHPVKMSGSTVDAGATETIGYVPTERDLDGKPRVAGKAIDMGCYEYQPRKGLQVLLR